MRKSTKFAPLDTSSELQRLRGLRLAEVNRERRGVKFQRDINGVRVNLTVNGYAKLYWINESEENTIIKLETNLYGARLNGINRSRVVDITEAVIGLRSFTEDNNNNQEADPPIVLQKKV